jgi:serine/threonine protein kinase
MLVCFQDDVHTYLCTDLADGGEVLDYVLARRGNLFPGDQITRYMWQLLQAVKYLHLHCIGHRDISLENILLKEGEFRLMDFGQAVSTHSAAGKPLRFFRPAGKANYRQPEAYLPLAQKTHVTAPLNAVPGSIVQASSNAFYEVRLPDDAVSGELCHADVCGYEPMPGDVFACGVAFFILTWHIPPWSMAVHSSQSFKIISGEGLPGLSRVLTLWNQRQDQLSNEAMTLLSSMIASAPQVRPSIADCIASSCFASFEAPAGDSQGVLDDEMKEQDETAADTTMDGSDAEMDTPVSSESSSSECLQSPTEFPAVSPSLGFPGQPANAGQEENGRQISELRSEPCSVL